MIKINDHHRFDRSEWTSWFLLLERRLTCIAREFCKKKRKKPSIPTFILEREYISLLFVDNEINSEYLGSMYNVIAVKLKAQLQVFQEI